MVDGGNESGHVFAVVVEVETDSETTSAAGNAESVQPLAVETCSKIEGYDRRIRWLHPELGKQRVRQANIVGVDGVNPDFIQQPQSAIQDPGRSCNGTRSLAKPLTISHTASTISCRPNGRSSSTVVVEVVLTSTSEKRPRNTGTR